MNDLYGLNLVSGPAQEPVSVSEAKLHCRIESDHEIEDEIIANWITAARIEAEKFQKRAYITQEWQMFLDRFPYGYGNSWRRLAVRIPLMPLQSVTHVEYLDVDGVQQTLADTEYIVDTTSYPGQIVPAYGKVWPIARCQINSVEIQFKAGYGDTSADVPEHIRSAIKLLVGHYYEHREEVMTGVSAMALPHGAERLLWFDRKVSV